MAEDLAEWMSRLFPELAGDMEGDNFFEKISDGTLLCHYASELHRRIIESDSDSKKDSRRRLQGVRVGGVNAFLPAEPPKYNSRGLKSQNLAGGSFWARDNIANFLKWCRSVGFPDSILFETEDLVSKRHLRSVIVCLMEVARLGGKFGMEVPEIVHLEKQIDAELAAEPGNVPKGELEDKPSTPNGNSPASEMASLDEVLLRSHVMVRTDGDWDTLNHFLEEYDACRKITPHVDLTCQSTANLTAGPLQLKPPKEFRLQVLDPEPADLKPTPTAYLAELGKKRAIHQEEDLFKQVDEHALLVAQQKQKNFKQLIWQLIYARNITSELERVRAIFLWLCTKDLNKMNFDNVKPGSPEETLMDIRANKTSYAQAFLTLCRYADLHCKLISGYAKGVHYSPGMQFTGSDHKHCWNAVLIDGTWRLVDCEWGARSKAKKGTNRGKLSYGLETYYFLTHPGQLIYSHFPHDTEWQLLHHPITLKEFESFTYVRPAFFKYNLTMPSQRNAVIKSKDSEVRIALEFPSDSVNCLFFEVQLTFNDQDFTEHYNSIPLKYVLKIFCFTWFQKT
ncbi:unnamed protein product [Dibothriocephalus latus]|uniref:Transglutaminase-like domain-containing protein n=1 Tax=Dibothriocephalus latus TaxID=60516 RepID=A0A3P6UM63_DIBLA|nr:unnamed protein product [Dibothriocephalus latus]